MPKLIVTFEGSVEFDEIPDDIGTVDVWLLQKLEDAVKKGTDECYESLRMRWFPRFLNESKPEGLSK